MKGGFGFAVSHSSCTCELPTLDYILPSVTSIMVIIKLIKHARKQLFNILLCINFRNYT